MEASRWKAVRAALEELADVPASERTAALERIAGDDDALRAELERMLPTWDNAPDLESIPATRATRSFEIGRRIGPWLIEQELGVGGMGHVFLARRAEGGFEQRVALKLIRRGLDTDKVLRRFERERALLARLAHTGIAQLYDGGATSDGLPWFAMELVEGRSIDRYCAEHHCDARARVELFLKVAAAVQHAHEHAVVHRDIKPSNILVSDDGLPKLLDFGIAKALEDTDTDEPTLTATGERVLTPLYASPEQWHGEPATIASDVFALGVVLYELLAGEPPRSREELAQLEREREWPAPERPSARAAHASDPTRLGVDTRALTRNIAGDLDLIVLKALQTEPARRYPTVERFAADLQRWLHGLPVEARADSLSYRTRRFVRRNKLMVGSIAAVVIGLTIGLGIAIAGWKNAADANAQVRAAQSRAQAQTAKLLQLSARQELQDLLAEAETLWPLSPDLLPRLDAWIVKAQKLVDDAPRHRATLAELDSPTLALDEQEKNWWHRQLESHLAELAAFTDEKSGVFTDASNSSGVGVLTRARLIRTALSMSAEPRWKKAWEDARAYVRTAPQYAGFELPDVFGLFPLGPDAHSGLLEFYDALTGGDPGRDVNDSLQLSPKSGLAMILIPPTSTSIGAQVTDPAAANFDAGAVVKAETPPWHVRLDAFLISKFEITQAQWKRLDGSNPSARSPKDLMASAVDQDLRPVQMISWDDCRRALDRYSMVLPSEAQWEIAARGGTTTPWWCGHDGLATGENLYDLTGLEVQTHEYAPENWHDGGGLTTPVGRYRPNPFGLFDVLGNVSEWCLDSSIPWQFEPRGGRALRNAPDNQLRGMRGGCYTSPASKARASYRMVAARARTTDVVGARPVILLVEDGPRWGQ